MPIIAKILMSSYYLSTVPNILELACVLIASYLIWKLLDQLCLSPLARIPGPKLAAVHELFGFRLSEAPFETLLELHKQYGPVVRVGPNEVAVASAEEMPKIYGVDVALHKAPLYEMFRSPDATGPMFAMRDVHMHKTRRRLLNPAFSRTSVMVLQPWLFKQCELLCDQLARAAGPGKAVDLLEYFGMLTGDTALKISFNIDGNMVKDVSGDLMNCSACVHQVMNCIKTEVRSPFFIRAFARPLIPYMPLWVKEWLPPAFCTQLFAMSTVEQLSERYLREYLYQTKESTAHDQEVLSRIVNAKDPTTGEKLSIVELTAESRSLILAGADTTSTTLSYAAWLIFQSPSVLATLREEISTVMPDPRTLPPDLSTLETLPYLTACIHEVMRLFPAIPGPFPRVVPRDGLEIDKYVLPAGSIVSASALAVHRSQPELWGAEPEMFRPERWLLHENVSAMRKAFLTFGTGLRSCIGRNIAMMQLYAMTAAFIARFDGVVVSSAEQMRPVGNFTLQPKSGKCLIQLTPAA